VKSDIVDAPYGKEFPIVLECKVIQNIEIGLHTEFIGEIMDVKVEESLLDEDGKVIMEKLDPILYTPVIAAYFAHGKYIGRGYTLGKDIAS
jgi:flavin reductase (DIM6/NTAB) family NADH-FMN oxidoreductase RutF